MVLLQTGDNVVQYAENSCYYPLDNATMSLRQWVWDNELVEIGSWSEFYSAKKIDLVEIGSRSDFFSAKKILFFFILFFLFSCKMNS